MAVAPLTLHHEGGSATFSVVEGAVVVEVTAGIFSKRIEIPADEFMRLYGWSGQVVGRTREVPTGG